MPTLDEALEFLTRWMKAPDNGGSHDYGYDVYIPNVAGAYVRQEDGFPPPNIALRIAALNPIFMAAAWELCRLGVLRPGVNRHDGQGSREGFGYSFMPAGRAWLSETDDHFIPTQPSAFARLLERFRSRFGPGFFQRAQEAVRCRWAGANLACCAMCGAAAESILLTLAVAKNGDEAEVLDRYRRARGRSEVRGMVFGQASELLQRRSLSYRATRLLA